MLSFKEKPYGLLLFTAIALMLAVVFAPIANMNFLDKTMFNVPMAIIVWIVPLLLIFFWLIYLLTKRFLYSMSITWIHVLITVSTTILTVIVLYIGINATQATSQNYNDTSLINRQQLIGNTMRILFIIFVCGQCIYLANILLGFLKNNKQIVNSK